jgi:hypothetical protein
MITPTHATLATFRMDPAREAEQQEGLQKMILPGVRGHPGFVQGTWTLDRQTSECFVMLTYESRESAESMRENIVGNADNQRFVGIELVEVRVLEVSATARSEGSAG